MSTIKEIADKLGVAVSTVSKGLNGANDISHETRQAVLDAAVELGYSPKKIKSGNGRKFCIFIENMAYENIEHFGYEVVIGFKLSAIRNNSKVDIIPIDLNIQAKEKYDTLMLKNKYSGAFLLGFTLHEDWVNQLNSTKVPTVLLDNYIENNFHVGYVGTDSYEGIDLAVSHLNNLGHRNIAFLNGSKNSMISQQRYNAFVNSLKKHEIDQREDLIAFGYYESECAEEYVSDFFERGATAIMCGSDLIALGVLNEAKRLGLRIPEDISVIGFDDLPIASKLTPPLTTIRQDRIDLGKSAFLLLDGLINNISTSRLLLRAKFINRESTGPARLN